MKYTLPKKRPGKKFEGIKSVNFRIPHDILVQFNKAIKDSKLNGQDLVEDAVRYCLKEAGYK